MNVDNDGELTIQTGSRSLEVKFYKEKPLQFVFISGDDHQGLACTLNNRQTKRLIRCLESHLKE